MTRRFGSGVCEVQYDGVTCIAKMVCFEWDISRIEYRYETWVYSILAQYRSEHLHESITPNFLGHLTEYDRVIGFLLQKVDRERACIDYLSNCTILPKRLYTYTASSEVN